MSRPAKPLGRGLSALLGEAPPSAGAASAGPRVLPVAALEPGPFQPRVAMEEGALSELAASIREHGLLQPILARPKRGAPGQFQIIGGERRWRAAQLAGLHEVPVLVKDASDREAMAAALVENLQRQDLNAVEEAEGYSRLVEQFGMTQDALARAVGKSRPHVANTLRLLNLPDRVRDLLREGALSAGHARALLGAPDPGALATQVVDRGLNVRQTEALVAQRAKPAEPKTRPERHGDPDLRRFEREVTERLGLKVAIAPKGKGGQVTISYGDLDQLDALMRLLVPGRY